MEFRILGPLEVSDGERLLPLGGPKQRSLLAMLLLNANKVVSVDRLLDALWGEQQPATGAKTLHVYVSQLRKALADRRVVTQQPGYMLRVEPGELDETRFRALLAKADRADPSEAADLLREALSLWRGPPLGDVAYEEFAQVEIARLAQLHASTIERRIDVDIELGRHRELAAELEGLVAAYPLRERLRAQLMIVLYRSGRQAEALEAYQAARRALVDELGIEPGRELRELEQAVLRQDPSLDLVAAAAAGVAEAPRSAFVGRDSELDALVGGLDGALSGRGGLYLLVGEPGVGKSRLGEELIRTARPRGFQVLVGRCWEAGGAPAYWPWVQALRAYARECETDELRAQLGAGAADVAQIIPELRERFPDLPEPPSLEAEGARFRLFDATTEFLRNAARSHPLLLALDDLHAADTPSLLLLQFLARQLADSRLLVLGALRDVDPIPGAALKETLAQLVREPVTRRLSLGGLSERAVAEYVELTAAGLGSPELITALYEETEGNPLFVTETVRLLAVEGLQRDETQTILAIPQSVRDVIARRLGHLSDECNGALELASALGREFSRTVLTTMSGMAEDALLETLDEAMTARLVTEVPGTPGRLRFAHVLIRDTLYDSLTTARRVRLHRLAVKALERLHREAPGPHLAELAHHAVAASEFDKAVDYARQAGNWTFELLAYEEAARLYDLALEAFDLANAREASERVELLLSLGDAFARGGDRPSSKHAFLRAAEMAERQGLPRDLARAAAGYGGRIVWARAGGDEKLVPLLESGLAALPDDDLELRIRLLARLAGALRDEHSRDRRDRLSREAVELARRSGDLATLADALDGRIAAIIAPDTQAEVLELATEMGTVGEQIADHERVVHSQVHRVFGYVLRGEMDEVERVLAAMEPVAAELRQPAQRWLVYSGQADVALALGKAKEAEALVSKAYAFGELAQPEMAIPAYHVQRVRLCDFTGGLEETEPGIRDVVDTFPARPVFRCVLAQLLARLDRKPEAQSILDDLAPDDFAALPFDQEWFFGMSLLADTAIRLADAERAAALYRLLRPWSAVNASDHPEGFRGAIARDLALLAGRLERWDDAERHFEDALAINTKSGALPWLAHTQAGYARLLRTRGGDHARAEELHRAALTTYDALGIRPEAREL
jgi:DNA-binding SARP family transcriptional activator